MNVDDEPPGIGKQKSGVVGDGAYIEHNPGYVVGELRCTDAFEKAVVDHFDRSAVQRWVQMRAIKIKVDAVRARNAGGLIGHLILQINGDAGIDRRGPVADSAHQGDLPGVQGRECAGLEPIRYSRLWRRLDGRRRHGWRGTRWRRVLLRLDRRRGHSLRGMRLLRPDGGGQHRVPFRSVMGLTGGMFFLMDVVQLELGLLCQRALWVDLEELLKCFLSVIAIAQVTAVDLTLGEEGGEAVAAGRILHAQEFVLADGVAEQSLIGKVAAFFGEELSHGEHTGIGFGRSGIAVVNRAIGIENPVVGELSTLRLRTGFEGRTLALRTVKRAGGTGVRGKAPEKNGKDDARLPSRLHAASRTKRTEQTRGRGHSCGSGSEPFLRQS